MTSTTQLVHEVDHKGKAQARLLGQFQDKPRMVAFARALGAGAQQAEDVLWDLLIGCTLDNSIGDQLDQWGDVVGQPRLGMSNTDYRQFIKARILANRCTGTLDEIIEITQIVTAPSTVVSFELYPKFIGLRVYRDRFLADNVFTLVRSMLRAIKPAGTWMEVVEAQAAHLGFLKPLGFGYSVGRYARLLS